MYYSFLADASQFHDPLHYRFIRNYIAYKYPTKIEGIYQFRSDNLQRRVVKQRTMKKVKCSDTVKTVISILSKEGLLFGREITKFDIFKAALNLLLSGVINVFIILDIINAVKVNNTKMANWMICVLIPVVGYVTKEFTLMINRKYFFSILQDLSSLNFNSHNDRQNRHIHLIDKTSSLLLKYFLISDSVIIVSFCVLPFAINIRMVVPPPFDTGRFDVLYKLFNLIASTYIGYNMTFLDVLYMTMMGLGIAQLNILKERLTEILEDANNLVVLEKDYNLHETDTIATRILRECVDLHQMIIK